MPNKKPNFLVSIVGPTAVGKTDLSINIAKQLNTEIVSADSRQFYKELEIGTAPPTPEQLNIVKHHFIGHLSIEDTMDIYSYEKQCIELLNELFLLNKPIVFTGGSGLYIDAVLNGLDELPDASPEVREELFNTHKNEGIEALRLMLNKLDPDFYKEVDLANPNRMIRALEVCITTGKPFSSFRNHEKKTRNFTSIKIGLNRDREELYNRINLRVDLMIEAGLIDEAKKFYPKRHLNSLKTVGYRELFDFFDNNCSLDFAIEKIKINSRRYAKRQLTWFNRDKEIKWFHPDEEATIIEYINSVVN
ncbi:MAG: tRNA (adenosine(37)-N6)-dimethylallyltransferase MiaA [Bacteroidota bacterium]